MVMTHFFLRKLSYKKIYLEVLLVLIFKTQLYKILAPSSKKKLAIDHYDRVFLFHQSHASFPPIAYKKSISLIVYNLGYLPGGDKQFTTLAAETLKSIDEALKLIRPQGMISITCYPGHPEGQREEEGLIAYLKTLSNKLYTICYHQWVNRHASPSLILIRRRF